MPNEINPMWEEYKFLKNEATTYTDVTFRDLQLLVTLVAAFIALMASGKGEEVLQNFWIIAIVQSITYVFLLIQLSRLEYLLTIRRHLFSIEQRLNAQFYNNKFQWESEVVPTQIAYSGSLNARIRYLIFGMYLLGFLSLSYYSADLSHRQTIRCVYQYFIGAQCLSFLYILGRHFYQNRNVKHLRRSKKKKRN